MCLAMDRSDQFEEHLPGEEETGSYPRLSVDAKGTTITAGQRAATLPDDKR